jgi:uncharacterized tellurite resistance protein B-like protein
MADPIRGFFESQIGPDAPPVYTAIQDEERRRLQVAACALLLELAHADDEFSDAERAHIDDVTRQLFGLNEDGAKQLLALAEAERAAGAGLHQFADLISSRFDKPLKIRLIEVMWALASSDGEIAHHESRMMVRVAELLGLTGEDLIEARGSIKPRA